MSPKFRGNSDDWLDDQGPRGRAREKKKPAARARFLSDAEGNARIAEVFPKQARVIMDEDGVSLVCGYKRAAIFGTSDVRERAPVAVGDRVFVKATSPSTGIIEGLCERTTFLFRPAPGRGEGELRHVIVSNIDRLVIVASAANPEFSSGIVDRYLVAAQSARITPVICINKIDLASIERPWKVYKDLGFKVFEVCAKKGDGIDALKNEILGRHAAFCGHSGVGKTSLLRTLLGTELGRVGEVNKLTKKGKHTTTAALLLRGPDHSLWIDTPGIKEFGLSEIARERLQEYFVELRDLKCPEPKCQHINEEGCLARGLPRYASYRRIYESL